MKVTLAYFKDNDKQWVSLLLNNISVCQKAVKDIVGNTIINQTLHVHGLYDNKSIFNIGVAKRVFRNLCERMYDNKVVIMNINGGCTNMDGCDWELVETKEFEVDYRSSLLDLLNQENNIIKVPFKEISK